MKRSTNAQPSPERASQRRRQDAGGSSPSFDAPAREAVPDEEGLGLGLGERALSLTASSAAAAAARSPLESLPDDLKRLIFSLLDPRDVWMARATSRVICSFVESCSFSAVKAVPRNREAIERLSKLVRVKRLKLESGASVSVDLQRVRVEPELAAGGELRVGAVVADLFAACRDASGGLGEAGISCSSLSMSRVVVYGVLPVICCSTASKPAGSTSHDAAGSTSMNLRCLRLRLDASVAPTAMMALAGVPLDSLFIDFIYTSAGAVLLQNGDAEDHLHPRVRLRLDVYVSVAPLALDALANVPLEGLSVDIVWAQVEPRSVRFEEALRQLVSGPAGASLQSLTIGGDGARLPDTCGQLLTRMPNLRHCSLALRLDEEVDRGRVLSGLAGLASLRELRVQSVQSGAYFGYGLAALAAGPAGSALTSLGFGPDVLLSAPAVEGLARFPSLADVPESIAICGPYGAQQSGAPRPGPGEVVFHGSATNFGSELRAVAGLPWAGSIRTLRFATPARSLLAGDALRALARLSGLHSVDGPIEIGRTVTPEVFAAVCPLLARIPSLDLRLSTIATGQYGAGMLEALAAALAAAPDRPRTLRLEIGYEPHTQTKALGALLAAAAPALASLVLECEPRFAPSTSAADTSEAARRILDLVPLASSPRPEHIQLVFSADGDAADLATQQMHNLAAALRIARLSTPLSLRLGLAPSRVMNFATSRRADDRPFAAAADLVGAASSSLHSLVLRLNTWMNEALAAKLTRALLPCHADTAVTLVLQFDMEPDLPAFALLGFVRNLSLVLEAATASVEARRQEERRKRPARSTDRRTADERVRVLEGQIEAERAAVLRDIRGVLPEADVRSETQPTFPPAFRRSRCP